WVARAEGRYGALRALGVDAALPRALWAALEVRARYRGYIERQRRTAATAAALDGIALPEGLWATELNGLSREAAEKLERWRPGTLGMASRIAGVSPSDVAVLMVHARRVPARRAHAGHGRPGPRRSSDAAVCHGPPGGGPPRPL